VCSGNMCRSLYISIFGSAPAGKAAMKHIVATLSRSLAQVLAERVHAYVRGAGMLGSVACPVSTLLENGML
jgi:hypothetical protein